MRGGVQDHVDAERVPVGRKLPEEAGVFPFALPRVGDVGVVGHHDHDPAARIANHPEVRLVAVGPRSDVVLPPTLRQKRMFVICGMCDTWNWLLKIGSFGWTSTMG